MYVICNLAILAVSARAPTLSSPDILVQRHLKDSVAQKIVACSLGKLQNGPSRLQSLCRSEVLRSIRDIHHRPGFSKVLGVEQGYNSFSERPLQ